MPIVDLQNVSKRYGPVTALDGVDLRVEAGSIHGIIGFSGAGKSTLLRCLCRLDEPDSGSIRIVGQDLAHLHGDALRKARRSIGVVFQQLHLLRSRTIAANVALGLELDGRSADERRSRVAELLRWFDLESMADRYPSQVSGGQRQRAAIARALALQPSVLLMDEPTSALDPETTASVLRLIRQVRDSFGVTVLLVTHQLDAVRAIGDRVSVLEAGRVVEEGPVERVFTAPSSSAARRLLTPSSELLLR
jgi:D-methionine transport system ATP-binding protein